jgi:hypothetical protein
MLLEVGIKVKRVKRVMVYVISIVKNVCLRCPVRILIETTKKHCRKYGHIDSGSNEYCPMVISYIFIIFFILSILYKIIYMYIYCLNVCYSIH